MTTQKQVDQLVDEVHADTVAESQQSINKGYDVDDDFNVVNLDTGEVIGRAGKLDALGREVIDPIPLAVRLGIPQKAPIEERIAAVLQASEFKAMMESRGYETLGDADDFEMSVEGDDPLTGYELVEMAPDAPPPEPPKTPSDEPELPLEHSEQPASPPAGE
ncbi:MAG: hypothetical protein OXR68_00290 [Alphaproteobacteria bacterium]|nr:hypothetical protein [Alphaproteobacteria bacterium]MDD9919050.1 hypothetical protein [Alphaproteobacteria bacterium]